MKRKSLHAALALCLCVCAGAAGADQVFKSTLPDGKVIYGNEPVKGAKKVEKITPNTQDAGVRMSTPKQKQEVDSRESQRKDEATRRQTELDQLKTALKQAEAARDAGREPQEGDVTGNARGGARLNEDYLERQKTLEANVREARKRLDDAQNRQ